MIFHGLGGLGVVFRPLPYLSGLVLSRAWTHRVYQNAGMLSFWQLIPCVSR